MIDPSSLAKIHDYLWEIPREFRGDMRVPARVYASEDMLRDMGTDRSLEQLVNVATLPGIVGYALAMPDAHEGYGFPVGGVAAFDSETGIISPGGIGYDINCGVRLLRSNVSLYDIREQIQALGDAIFRAVPAGVGQSGQLELHGKELDRVLASGARRMAELGYAEDDDLFNIESGGMLAEAQPDLVSENAKRRGCDQLGTMGAGNHFVEVDAVETIFDADTARAWSLFEGQVTVLIHTGSRGMGHQIATDYIRVMVESMAQHGIHLPDRELACAPFGSAEGQQYFQAMAAGANFAWANRQLITWEIRKAWQAVLGPRAGGLKVVYDVAHNIAKQEEHVIGGVRRRVVVHRKGATRAFPRQPVLIPGSMGTHSYVLEGQPGSLLESFGSSCHGAGRRMSRTRARKQGDAAELMARLRQADIRVSAASKRGLVEEAPEAYKDVDAVVDIVHRAGIAKKVARLKPVAVIKG